MEQGVINALYEIFRRAEEVKIITMVLRCFHTIFSFPWDNPKPIFDTLERIELAYYVELLQLHKNDSLFKEVASFLEGYYECKGKLLKPSQ